MEDLGTTSKAKPTIRGHGKGAHVGLAPHVQRVIVAKGLKGKLLGKGIQPVDDPHHPDVVWAHRIFNLFTAKPPDVERIVAGKGLKGKFLGKGIHRLDDPHHPALVWARGIMNLFTQETEAATQAESQRATGSGVTQESEAGTAGVGPGPGCAATMPSPSADSTEPNPALPMPSVADLIDSVNALPQPVSWIKEHISVFRLDPMGTPVGESMPTRDNTVLPPDDLPERIHQLLIDGIAPGEVAMAVGLDLDPVKLWIYRYTEGTPYYIAKLLIAGGLDYCPSPNSHGYARESVKSIEVQAGFRQLQRMRSGPRPTPPPIKDSCLRRRHPERLRTSPYWAPP